MNQPMEGHTVHRYDGEISHLHMLLLEMGGLVLDQTKRALDALGRKDLQAARAVMERDHRVNELEVKVDDEIASVIARRSPVARDLRIILSISKAVTDLERIGDEAARIAGLCLGMYDNDRPEPSTHLLRDCHTMGNLALGFLDEGLQVFDCLDAERAEELVQRHRELDAEFQSGMRRLATFVLEDARNVGHAINATLMLKSLERIGDHAANLADYVVYLIKGEDVRHRYSQAKARPRGAPDGVVDPEEGD